MVCETRDGTSLTAGGLESTRLTRQRRDRLMDRARDDARKKYEQGEKLSLDELKLVFADDNEVLK